MLFYILENLFGAAKSSPFGAPVCSAASGGFGSSAFGGASTTASSAGGFGAPPTFGAKPGDSF